MLSHAPRTEPYERHSRIRLPPWMFDGEALLRPGVKDARPRQIVVREPRDPLPRRLVSLAAPPQRPSPEIHDAVTECLNCPDVRRHRVIRKVASTHLPQPRPLPGDRLVPPPLQFLFHCPQLRLQPVAPGPALEQEPAPSRLAADEGEAEEVKGFRLA